MKVVASVLIIFVVLVGAAACGTSTETYDLVIRNGLIYDGYGGDPYPGGVVVHDGHIVTLGEIPNKIRGIEEVEANGMAIAPGFINMLSWSVESLIEDGRAQATIRQGVTLEVMGESFSWGPFNDQQKQEILAAQSDVKYEINWSTLGEFLEYLVDRGISTNVASFVGSSTVRTYVIGNVSRTPTDEELQQMQQLVREAMEEGALGVGSALIYVPDTFNRTEDLIALCKAAGEYGGMYISHLRSQGTQLLEATQELIFIAGEAGVRAEIYHLKAAGRENWYKLPQMIQMIEDARAEGIEITADMYTYTAGATGLEASMPPWIQEGGYDAWRERLLDPELRARAITEMESDQQEWENLYRFAGAEGMLFSGFRNDDLKPLIGKTLAEVAAERGTSPAETICDLVVEDGSRVETIYFHMNEDNVRKEIALPWVSFGSDAPSIATEGNFLKSNPHPRTYGTFSRLLGKYVREEKIITLAEAIRRLTSLPAGNLRIRDRGALKEGYWADIVIFNPDTIQDHATYEEPHQYSTGVEHVFVNGVQVLKGGEHTDAKPGMVVRGPGWTGWDKAKQ